MIDREFVKTEVRRQAFEVTDPESSEFGRRLHHCFLGTIGADWDEQGVLDLIDRSDYVAWESSFLWGDGLTVGRHFFDTIREPRG